MLISIGENIKKLRAERGVTQEQLAEHLAITYQSVSKWENNVTAPDLQFIPMIAEYFEVSIDELFKQNMKGYKNKAERLFAIYEQSGKKEDFDRADAEYEKIFAENKGDREDMRSYGVLNEYRSVALAKKAEELYRQAIDEGEEAEAQLMQLLSRTSRNEENIKNQEEALKNEPDNVRNWRLLVLAYDFANFYEKAFETAKKGLEKFPNDVSLLRSAGDLCRTFKRYDEALKYHEQSIAQNPDNGGSYYSIAFIYKDLKKYKEAIEAWKKVDNFYIEKGYGVERQWPQQEIAKLQVIIEENTAE